MDNEAEASTEQGMLISMRQSGGKGNKEEVTEYLRDNDIHADALAKSQDRLLAHKLPTSEVKGMTQAEWLASQYTPNTEAIQHGWRQGAANAMALPNLVGDVFRAPTTFANNLMGADEDYFSGFEEASQVYGETLGAPEYEGYVRTPGNVGGDLAVQLGTEVMMPFGGGITALRAPSAARKVKVVAGGAVNPDYVEGRRVFMGTMGKGAAVAAAPLMAMKVAKEVSKHGDTLTKTAGSKTAAGNAAKVAARTPWFKSIVSEIYKADQITGDNLRKFGGRVGRTIPRPAATNWLHHRGYVQSDRSVVPGDIFRDRIITNFNKAYDQKIGGGKSDFDRLTPAGRKASLRRKKLDDEINRLTGIHRDAAESEAYELAPDLFDHQYDDFVDNLAGARMTEDSKYMDMVGDAREMLSVKAIVKYDPNTIKYRKARMEELAEKHGVQLWELELKRLEDAVGHAEQNAAKALREGDKGAMDFFKMEHKSQMYRVERHRAMQPDTEDLTQSARLFNGLGK